MTTSIEVVGAGITPIEAVPVFHYYPGAIALRLIVASRIGYSVECEGHSICNLIDASRSSWVRVPLERISWRVDSWNIDLVIGEGLEPGMGMDPDSLRDAIKKPIGIRALGFRHAPYSSYDLVLFDIIQGIKPWHSAILSNLDRALRESSWIEVAVHLTSASDAGLAFKVADIVGRRPETPLHIIIAEPGGGGAARALADNLAEKLDYVYVHAGPYSRLDTLCPTCRTPVVTRWSERIESVSPSFPHCPSCGKAIPFHGPRITRARVIPSGFRRRGVSLWFNAVEL